MINIIFYLTKYHLHSFFLFKNSMIGMVKKHDPIQEIPKIHAKQFSREDFSSNNMKTIPELKCIEWDPTKQVC